MNFRRASYSDRDMRTCPYGVCPYVRKYGRWNKDMRTDRGAIYSPMSVRPHVLTDHTEKQAVVRKSVRN